MAARGVTSQKLAREIDKLPTPISFLESAVHASETTLPVEIQHDEYGHRRILTCPLPEIVIRAFRYACRRCGYHCRDEWSKISRQNLQSNKKVALPKMGEIRRDLNGKRKDPCKDVIQVVDAIERYLDGYLVAALGAIGAELHSDAIDWRVGLLYSSCDDFQDPHTDYDARHLSHGQKHRRIGAKSGENDNGKHHPFKNVGPYLFEFPLYKDGFKIEFWPDVNSEEYKRKESAAVSTAGEVLGKVVHIPHGSGVLFRGDCVHAGGLRAGKNAGKHGNFRVHLYVYLPGGTVHNSYLTTNYHKRGEERWSDTHKHGDLHRKIASQICDG